MTPRMQRRSAPLRGDGTVGRPRTHAGRVSDHDEAAVPMNGQGSKLMAEAQERGSAVSEANKLTRRGPEELCEMGDARERMGF